MTKTNLKLIINNNFEKNKKNFFFEKKELKIILNLYAKMVSQGTWKDYGLTLSAKQAGFSVFKNSAENAMYKICKNFKPNNKNFKYIITDSKGVIYSNSENLEKLLESINWKKLK